MGWRVLKGMADWKAIKDKLSNKNTPDYCIAMRKFAHSLSCTQRIDKANF